MTGRKLAIVVVMAGCNSVTGLNDEEAGDRQSEDAGWHEFAGGRREGERGWDDCGRCWNQRIKTYAMRRWFVQSAQA